MTADQPQPWPVQSSEIIADCRIFKVRKDLVTSPRTNQSHEMFVLEHPNWVNVIPLTPDGQVILIKQWRHGTRSVHLETPGGLMDDEETPEEAARRELLEETGYAAGSLVQLGRVDPNPAIQGNDQFYMLAKDCRKVADPKFDHAEDIAVNLVPLANIPQMIASGKITHGIVIGAFYWLDLYREKNG